VSGLLNLFSRPSGGMVSDWVSARGGHRHRITWLFATTLLAGACMILFGALPLGLAPATVLMVLYSIFYEQACGATYALVPLVSNRSPGLVSGFVSSGGTAGAALWNGVVFKSQLQVRAGAWGRRWKGGMAGQGGGGEAEAAGEEKRALHAILPQPSTTPPAPFTLPPLPHPTPPHPRP
jgi:nitrate/nitrite transporter NarK